jgi:hypothetical protein
VKRLRRTLGPLVIPVLAIITAFIVGSIFLLITDFNNLSLLPTDPGAAIGGALGTIGEAYGSLIVGAFGDPSVIIVALGSGEPRELAAAIRPLTETLVAATPLIFTGLAVAVSFRSGVFNIGVEGQFIIGAFGATTAALVLQGQPAALILIVAIFFGIVTGAFWGFIPGFLKARTGAHEVITTIMRRGDTPYLDYLEGVVRNNMVFNRAGIHLESGIEIMNVQDAGVYHNTVYSADPAFSSIEYRWPETRVVLKNNLVRQTLMRRDNAQATLEGNLENAPAALFANAGTGDLHLAAASSTAIDQGVRLPSGLADFDIDGGMRDGFPDIGADEFRSGAGLRPRQGKLRQAPSVQLEWERRGTPAMRWGPSGAATWVNGRSVEILLPWPPGN